LITLDQIIKDSAVLFKKDINIVENSPNKTTSRNVDNSKARQKLNWNPKISFKDGLNNLFNRLK
jgi:nucleoside-diphosphate-sugar epimerase